MFIEVESDMYAYRVCMGSGEEFTMLSPDEYSEALKSVRERFCDNQIRLKTRWATIPDGEGKWYFPEGYDDDWPT